MNILNLPHLYNILEGLNQSIAVGDGQADLSFLFAHCQKDAQAALGFSVLEDDPLFGEMIMELAKQGRMRAPISLSSVYEECCLHLLNRSTVTQVGNPCRDAAATLSKKQLFFFLESLALELVFNQNTLTVEATDVHLNKEIAFLVHPPADLSAQGVRQVLVEQIGILRVTAPGYISFSSPHLQAFFAARAIHNREAFDILVGNAHRLDWQDIVLLAAAQASVRENRLLLGGLLVRANTEEVHAPFLGNLLASAYQVAFIIDPTLRRNIERRLKLGTSLSTLVVSE